MKIGDTIRDLRIERGISQSDFAKTIKLSQTSISQIENNIKRPSKSTLKKISGALGVPEVYFYLFSLEKGDIPEKNHEMFERLYPSIKEMVKNIVL